MAAACRRARGAKGARTATLTRHPVPPCADDPILINSHSGRDSFTMAMADEFFGEAVEFQDREGMRARRRREGAGSAAPWSRAHPRLACAHPFPPFVAGGALVVHETHRKRFLHSPWVTRDFLPNHPKLKLAADLRCGLWGEGGAFRCPCCSSNNFLILLNCFLRYL